MRLFYNKMVKDNKKKSFSENNFFPKNRKESSPKNNFFPKNRKAVSGVVVAVIMIALVMATSLIVWVVVKNIIESELSSIESCFGIFDKVTINNRYTCYNSTANKFQFSISVGDIEVDEVLVSVSGAGAMKSFRISNEEKSINDLGPYPSGTGNVKLPGKNSGLTYIYDIGASGGKPDLIEIAPIIKGKPCEVIDSLSEIDDCFSLA